MKVIKKYWMQIVGFIVVVLFGVIAWRKGWLQQLFSKKKEVETDGNGDIIKDDDKMKDVAKPPLTELPPPTQPILTSAGDSTGTTEITTEVVPVSSTSPDGKKAIAERVQWLSASASYIKDIFKQIGATNFANGQPSVSEVANSINGKTITAMEQPNFLNVTVPETKVKAGNSLLAWAINNGGLVSNYAKSESGADIDTAAFMFRDFPASLKDKMLVIPKLKLPNGVTINLAPINLYTEASKLAVSAAEGWRSKLDTSLRQNAIASLKAEGWKFTDV